MAQWQGRSKKKPSGGRIRLNRSKRKFEIGREEQNTSIGQPDRKVIRTRGGHSKVQLYGVTHVNLTDPKTGKVTRTKVTKVLENVADPNYVQRNIITKGAIVQTDAGKARVTSRPGQHGVLNVVLIG